MPQPGAVSVMRMLMRCALSAIDRAIVDEPEIDDVHGDLGVVDRSQRVVHLVEIDAAVGVAVRIAGSSTLKPSASASAPSMRAMLPLKTIV